MFYKQAYTYGMILALSMSFAVATLIVTGCCPQKSEDIKPAAKDPSSGRPKDPPSSVERGKHLFDTRGCMGCHTVNGQGGHVGLLR